jgi:hypothetical protein
MSVGFQNCTALNFLNSVRLIILYRYV